MLKQTQIHYRNEFRTYIPLMFGRQVYHSIIDLVPFALQISTCSVDTSKINCNPYMKAEVVLVVISGHNISWLYDLVVGLSCELYNQWLSKQMLKQWRQMGRHKHAPINIIITVTCINLLSTVLGCISYSCTPPSTTRHSCTCCPRIALMTGTKEGWNISPVNKVNMIKFWAELWAQLFLILFWLATTFQC